MNVKKGDVIRVESPIMCVTDRTVFEVRSVPGEEEYDSQEWMWAEEGCTIQVLAGECPGSVGEDDGYYWINRAMILEVM